MINLKNYEEVLELLKTDDYPYDNPTAMDDYIKYGFIRKDIADNDLLKIIAITNCDRNKGQFFVMCDNFLEIGLSVKKEKRFFELNNFKFANETEIFDWLESDLANKYFIENEITVVVSNDRDSIIGSLTKSYVINKQNEFFNQIKSSNKVYQAKIIDKNRGGFIASIDGVQTFLPGSLASANKILNFEDLIGKVIDVMVEDYLKEDNTFIISNKKYINYILNNEMEKLTPGEEYEGTVTGTSKFGIFIEWNTIFTGLLHISEMKEERKNNFYSKVYKPGSKITFFIKEITNENKIILTDYKSQDEKFTLNDFKEMFEKTIYEGNVFNISDYGAFVKLIYKDNSFVGLLYYKDYPKNFEPKINDNIDVFIDYIDIESNKIYLKIKK